MLNSTNIKRWLDSVDVKGREVPERNDPETMARHLLLLPTNGVTTRTSAIADLAGTGELPDVAFSLCDVVSSEDVLTQSQLADAGDLWRLIGEASWPANDFDEQKDVLATLASRLASRARQLNDYPSMVHWEETCAALVSELEPSGSYLAVFSAGRNPTVDQRVLDDITLLLAFCRQQESRRNQAPRLALESSTRVFGLIEQRTRVGALSEELGYCAASLAISAAVSAAHFQYHQIAMHWVGVAERYLRQTPNCAWLLPLADCAHLMIVNSRHDHRAVVRDAPGLAEAVELLRADRHVMSVRIAQAQSLKTLALHAEAIRVLEDLCSRYANGEKLRLGIAYSHLADARLESGDKAGAVRDCKIAYELLRNLDSSMALPPVQTVVGQLLRVMGRTGDAVSALRSAAESYSAAEFKSWAGYSRVLAAETLLLAERPSEALEELVIALQLLEGSESEHELWAAVKLLHSAVAATKPTASEMRSCREKLERIRKSHF